VITQLCAKVWTLKTSGLLRDGTMAHRAHYPKPFTQKKQPLYKRYCALCAIVPIVIIGLFLRHFRWHIVGTGLVHSHCNYVPFVYSLCIVEYFAHDQ
jgi:hypothetical protein